MSTTKYSTWENDFLSDRWELFGYEGEMIAAVYPPEGSSLYCVELPNGTRVFSGMQLEHAKTAAQGLLDTPSAGEPKP